MEGTREGRETILCLVAPTTASRMGLSLKLPTRPTKLMTTTTIPMTMKIMAAACMTSCVRRTPRERRSRKRPKSISQEIPTPTMQRPAT